MLSSQACPYIGSLRYETSRLARVPNRLGQHGVKLTLGEILGLLRYRQTLGYYPVHRESAGRQRCFDIGTILGLAVGGL
jgi:hypothetical protein